MTLKMTIIVSVIKVIVVLIVTETVTVWFAKKETETEIMTVK